MVVSRLFPSVFRRWWCVLLAVVVVWVAVGGAAGAAADPPPSSPTQSSSPTDLSPTVSSGVAALLEQLSQAEADNNKVHDGEEYSVEKKECVAGKLAEIRQRIRSGEITGEDDLKFQLDEAFTVCMNKAFGAHPWSGIKHGAGLGAKKVWEDAIGKLAKAALSGVSSAFSWLLDVWTHGVVRPETLLPMTRGMRNLTLELQLLVMAVSLMLAGAKLAFDRKRALLEGAEETAAALARAAGAAFFLPSLVVTLHNVGDAISQKVISDAAGGDLRLAAQSIQGIADNGDADPVVVLTASIVALLGLFAQIIALVVRDVVLIVVVGLAPFAAAASATSGGKRSWEQVTAFTLAALLFKPIGSMLYAVVFWTQQQASGSSPGLTALSTQMVGLILLALSGFIMPGLVKIMVPAAAALGSSSALTSTMFAGAGMAAGAAAGVAAKGAGLAAQGAGAAVAKTGGSLAASGGAAGREMRQVSRMLATSGGSMSSGQREALQTRLSHLSSKAEHTQQRGAQWAQRGENLQQGGKNFTRQNGVSQAARQGLYLGGMAGGAGAAAGGSAIGHYPGRIVR